MKSDFLFFNLYLLNIFFSLFEGIDLAELDFFIFLNLLDLFKLLNFSSVIKFFDELLFNKIDLFFDLFLFNFSNITLIFLGLKFLFSPKKSKTEILVILSFLLYSIVILSSS